METKYQLVFCVINAGFSEAVMAAARKAGARGGTILKGRGTASREAEQVFNIKIQPEKEIVMILAESGIRNEILHELYASVGLDTPGQGIAFSLPVDGTAGLVRPEKD